MLSFFQELCFFLKFPRPLTFPPGESRHKLPLSPFWIREAPEPHLPAPTLFAETKSSATSQGQAAQGRVTWSHPPGEARPVMSPRSVGGGCDAGLAFQALPRCNHDPGRPLLAAAPSKPRKPTPEIRFFSLCIFCFFKFFFCKMSRSSITYKHDFYGGVEGKVTGGRALLCRPREDRDVTSRLSSLSLSSHLYQGAHNRVPFKFQNSLRDPRPPDTVPWRWGSSSMRWVPSFPLPWPQEGGRGGEGGGPAVVCRGRATGLSRW